MPAAGAVIGAGGGARLPIGEKLRCCCCCCCRADEKLPGGECPRKPEVGAVGGLLVGLGPLRYVLLRLGFDGFPIAPLGLDKL